MIKEAKPLAEAISSQRSTVRKVLDTQAGKDYGLEYYNKKVGDAAYPEGFEQWYANVFKKYVSGDPLNFEVHHIIPIKELKKNLELQKVLSWAKENNKEFRFNDIDNAIPVPKKSLKFDQSGHANHPAYDTAINDKLNDILNSPLFNTYDKKYSAIKSLVKDARAKLKSDVLLGDSDVNQIVNF